MWMTEERYRKTAQMFRNHPAFCRMVGVMNKVLTAAAYLAYIVLLASVVLRLDAAFWKLLFVPAVSFFLVTVFRKAFNAKRPYEIFHTEPVLKRKKKGQSFPSRHAFSIFMIAMAVGYVSTPAGIVFFVMGIWLAALRVLGGVHFPRDVAAGAAAGIGLGILGFYII